MFIDSLQGFDLDAWLVIFISLNIVRLERERENFSFLC